MPSITTRFACEYSSAANVNAMMKEYPNRILVINHDDMMSQPASVMKRVFTFVGLTWDPGYLNMTGLKRKYSTGLFKTHRLDDWKFTPWKHSAYDPDQEQQGMLPHGEREREGGSG